MIEAVVFDIDGTLIDSVDAHARSWQRAFHEFGIDVPFEEVRAQIGKGGDLIVPTFMPPDAVARRGKELEAWRLELFEREYLPQIRPFPGVPALFERIRRDRGRIVLASSAKAEELASYKRIARIEGLVDAETASDDAERSKPYPDIFEAALRQVAVAPERAVVVGDTPYDAEGARAAGVRTIGVLSGGFSEQTLRAAGAIEVYRDVAHLLARYDESLLVRG